ncbi:MAG: trypsin-like peptidase domain-containing protein [Lachnospiraceae bacterium]|nr:trypsin-like peptidase domain-containing protein [Lachnospiraceae bacterium]
MENMNDDFNKDKDLSSSNNSWEDDPGKENPVSEINEKNETRQDEPSLEQNPSEENFASSYENETEENEKIDSPEKSNENKQDVHAKEVYYTETIKKKKGHPFKKFITACLIISIVGGSFIGGSFSVAQYYLNKNSSSSETAAEENSVKGFSSVSTSSAISQTASTLGNSSEETAVNIIKAVAPSIVSITTKISGTTMSFFGNYVPYEGSGAGSGVVFNEDGTKVFICTNAHVIDDATEVYVSWDDETSIEASLVGKDTTADLAVLSVLKTDLLDKGISKVSIATFGDSNKLQMGESVIAIGNALGEGKSATGGMISIPDKTIQIDGKEFEMIQTDAAINPGNSGGALVNYKGEVIGINSAKSFEQAVEGMGYAIPSNIAVPYINELLENGTIARPYLGISGASVTDDLAEIYGLPIGVYVAGVVEGGSAEKAGLQKGDVIVAFNGETILDMETLQKSIAKQEIGATVDIKIIRNNSSMTLKATIQNANG